VLYTLSNGIVVQFHCNKTKYFTAVTLIFRFV